MEDVPIVVQWIAGIFAAFSLAVWIKAGIQTISGEPLLKATAEPLTPVHWMPLLLTILLVSQSLLSLFEVKKAPTEIELAKIQAKVMLSCIMLVLLVVPLLQTRNTAAGLGFTTDRWGQQIGAGLVGFIASVLPVLLCVFATISMREAANEHPLLQAVKKDGSMELVVWICIAAVIAAPILEELVYRVILQTWLQHIIEPRQALIIVAAVFAAVHRLPDAIPLFPLALILGYMYQQRRRFLEIVVVHALFNAVNLTLALMSD
jgi:uncharacterized protein